MVNNYITTANILNKKAEMLEVAGDESDFCLLLKSKVVRVKRNTASLATEYDQATQHILPRPPPWLPL